jgi:hypothetical protein
MYSLAMKVSTNLYQRKKEKMKTLVALFIVVLSFGVFTSCAKKDTPLTSDEMAWKECRNAAVISLGGVEENPMKVVYKNKGEIKKFAFNDGGFYILEGSVEADVTSKKGNGRKDFSFNIVCAMEKAGKDGWTVKAIRYNSLKPL